VEREVTKRMMTIKMSRIPMHTVLLKGSINGSTKALVSGSIIGDGIGHWLIVHTTRVHSTINGHMVILCRAPGHFALLDGLGAMSPCRSAVQNVYSSERNPRQNQNSD
jgi:hypothetical protein